MRNIQWFINVCIAVVGKVNNSKCIFQIYLREAGKLIVYLPAIIHGENAPESPQSGTTEGYKRGLYSGDYITPRSSISNIRVEPPGMPG